MKTIQINKLYFYVSTLVDEPVLKVKVTAQNDTHANLYRINILDDRHCTVDRRGADRCGVFQRRDTH